MEKVRIASELVRIAKELISMEFPTKEAMDKYLKEHPEADKTLHHVRHPQKVELELKESGGYKEPTSWPSDFKGPAEGKNKDVLDVALKAVGSKGGKILRHYGDLFVMSTDEGQTYSVGLNNGKVDRNRITRK